MKKILFIYVTLNLFVANALAQELNYEVTAKKLDKSRSNLSPKTYGTAFNFERENIDNLPQGQASSLNQILLRAPGVSQDSFGQIHIRNDHSNIQYRINDVIIPEGINSFGQVLDARFVESASLLTGAMPAQYGYRTAGVVEIKTKDSVSRNKLDSGAYSELQYGSNQTAGINQQFSGAKNGLSYFVSGSYLQNSRGIESPTSARKSIHNDTSQDKLFGYFSYLLNSKNRLSVILANATNRYQIPNTSNQTPDYEIDSQLTKNSSQLNQNQSESNRFAILALQGITDNEIDYQISTFARHSDFKFRGDKIGDLIFDGTSSNIDKSSLNYGLQGDFSKKLNDKNILRVGLYASDTRIIDSQRNLTFEGDENGQTSTAPLAINDKSQKNTQLYSIYAQNEYKPIDKLTLNGGLRFDKVNSQNNDNHLSPRFNAVYQATKKLKFHSGYARYFTAPKAELLNNFNIRRFEGTVNAPETFDFNQVKSEKTNYYDLGTSYQISKELHIGLDAYHKEVADMLDEGQFGQALVFKPFNYKKALISGLELSGDYKYQNLNAFANIAYQRAKAKGINSGQYLHGSAEVETSQKFYLNPDHAQKITASGGLAYKFLKTKTDLGFDVLYGNGLRRGDLNRHRMKSYSQLNIFILQKIEKFNLRLSINNVLDKKYALRDGSGIGVQASQFAPRRSAYLILSREF
ncbi:MAG: TonB-dependent receptor [Alphaproteobacteria bacterium]|nr:TonB-dependent receptor [Alphaproteobacteria bacterium]